VKRQLFDIFRRAVEWGEKVPWGLRTLLGTVLMIGGVFGFLPILGFWMLPVGAAFIALDVPPWRRRLLSWLNERTGHASAR